MLGKLEVLLFTVVFFFFQAEDGIRDIGVTGVQTCALPIFPVVGEELGFVGVMVALVLLMALILILLRIARRATDPYSSLCVFGVAGLLFTHIIENVGMTVNLLPITGIPLPFFSYGGSFLLACSIAVGISLRVAWESRQSGYAEL